MLVVLFLDSSAFTVIFTDLDSRLILFPLLSETSAGETVIVELPADIPLTVTLPFPFSIQIEVSLSDVTLEFEDLDVHADIDGGHTYKIILEQQENLDYGEQFVKTKLTDKEILNLVKEQGLQASKQTTAQNIITKTNDYLKELRTQLRTVKRGTTEYQELKELINKVYNNIIF